MVTSGQGRCSSRPRAPAAAAAAVTLTRLREEAAAARSAIEARLCLGMPAEQAFAPHLHAALRTALIPSIDSTRTVGLISLPGAMTGLILAGVSPLTAIRYQIVVMYMLLAAAALAALTAARLAERALFDDAHRLRPLSAAPGTARSPGTRPLAPQAGQGTLTIGAPRPRHRPRCRPEVLDQCEQPAAFTYCREGSLYSRTASGLLSTRSNTHRPPV